MDLRLGQNINPFQVQKDLKKPEEKGKTEVEAKPVEVPKTAPEAKPVTASAAEAAEMLGRGMVANNVAKGSTKDDDYNALVKQWNELLAGKDVKFPYSAKLKLLDAIIAVAPREEIVRWNLVKIEVIQNNQQNTLNHYIQDPGSANLDEVLAPWSFILDDENYDITQNFNVTPELQEPWQTVINIYNPSNPDYSSAQERDMIADNIQAWTILKTAIELKLSKLSEDDPLYKVNRNRLSTCDFNIEYWTAELKKYNPAE